MTTRNRIVELQQPMTTPDDFGGAGVITWTTRAEVWASFQNVGKNKERFIRGSSKEHVFRTGEFGILPPLVDFDERWRIVEVDGLARTWEVVGIGREGRKDWKITVKA